MSKSDPESDDTDHLKTINALDYGNSITDGSTGGDHRILAVEA
jgi:hypothetical protein